MSTHTSNMKQIIAYVPTSVAETVESACRNLNCSKAIFTHLAVVLLVQHERDDPEFVSEMLQNLTAEKVGKHKPRAYRYYECSRCNKPGKECDCIPHTTREWTKDWQPICIEGCPGCKQDAERSKS